MRVACAWCKRDMGYKEPLDDPSISHGMCDECRHKQAAEGEAYFTLNPPKNGGNNDYSHSS